MSRSNAVACGAQTLGSVSAPSRPTGLGSIPARTIPADAIGMVLVRAFSEPGRPIMLWAAAPVGTPTGIRRSC